MSRHVVPGSVVDSMLAGYRAGLFPMADGEGGPINLCMADPRGVMPLTEEQGFRVPRSVARAQRGRRFIMRSDRAFIEVVRGCATDRDDGVWISAELIGLYRQVFQAGYAHSVEAWLRDEVTGAERLVGGVYGVAIGAAFFAESMFCRPRPRRGDGARDPFDGTDASKVSLVTLVGHLRACGFRLLDTQMVTEQTARFGAFEVSEARFGTWLGEAVAEPDAWRPLAAPGEVGAGEP